MRVHVQMTGRDPEQEHRASTPLELFFDLVFVVAIAQAATALHHAIAEGHVGDGISSYAMVFFAIWWAWMNFTWFASGFDTDDVVYRITTFVVMVGALILAAGVSRASDGHDLDVIVAGYVVMRIGMVAHWLRAARSVPEARATAHRYAAGIAIVQVYWVGLVVVDVSWTGPAFLVGAALEMTLPMWAEAAGRTSWHPAHIAERYGLFTIIVLGESILASTTGVQAALAADSGLGDLATTVVGGVLIVLSMWWIYFDLPTERVVSSARGVFADRLSVAFSWGYGHYVVFASAAATGAGFAVAIDHLTGHSSLSDVGAGLAITVPVALYVVTVWVLHRRYRDPAHWTNVGVPLGAAAIVASSFTPEPVLLTGLVLVLLVVATVVATHRESPQPA